MSLVDRKQFTLSELQDSPQVSNGAQFAQSFVFYVAVCRSLLVPLFFFLRQSFFDLRLLITNVVTTGVDPGGWGDTRRAPPKIGKNKIVWRKIVIFHTKYPKHFRASLRSAQFF
jgi:hypothetical protein